RAACALDTPAGATNRSFRGLSRGGPAPCALGGALRDASVARCPRARRLGWSRRTLGSGHRSGTAVVAGSAAAGRGGGRAIGRVGSWPVWWHGTESTGQALPTRERPN